MTPPPWSPKRWLKERLLGPFFAREYLTLKYVPDATYPSFYASTRERPGAIDVTSRHLMLGLKPLVVGLEVDAVADEMRGLALAEEICLTILEPPVAVTTRWKGFPTDPDAAGRILLTRCGEVRVGNEGVILFEGRSACNRLVPAFYRFTHALNRFRFRHRSPPDALGLSFDLYDQVRLIYSRPRPISVVTVEVDGRTNLFPVDFQGMAGESLLLISLRKGSLAGEQVTTSRRIALASLGPEAAKKVYDLGKNHMSLSGDAGGLEFHARRSRIFGFPLLPETLEVVEAQLLFQRDIGAQILHVFRVEGRERIAPARPGLAHAHFFFALRKRFRGEPFSYVER